MDALLTSHALWGTVEAPTSKSYMHRALICAALADKKTILHCRELSNDVIATIRCLRALGAEIEEKENTLTVTPVKSAAENALLDCGESGTTLRFMLPLCAAIGKRAELYGSGRLPLRPIAPLVKSLEDGGARVVYKGKDNLPCEIYGGFGKTHTVEAGVSSQFISGLLLASAKDGAAVKAVGSVVSAPYIEMTLDVMNTFGIKTEKTESGINVFGGVKSPGELWCEGDWSNAAFWLVAGAVASEKGLKVNGIKKDSIQGDKKIADILKQMGADIKIDKNDVSVKKSVLRAIETDAGDIPDLVPVLCVAASCAHGTTVIKNISRLREKESDRIKTTADMITALGGKIEAFENEMHITGAPLTGGTVDGAGDHRIVMSAAAASFAASGNVKILGANAAEKSYPAFFDDYRKVECEK